MTVEDLKVHIIDNNAIEDILLKIGCHHIRQHDGYYTCGNPDGDNINAITVYCNDNITVVNYTRQIAQNKRTTDIFDLIMHNQNITFPEALNFVCELLGLNYYSSPEDKPESLIILKMLKDMSIGNDNEDTIPLKPIPEEILSYYLPYPNKMFEDDGISLEIQQEFGVCYDPHSNRVAIPIRSPVGDLCGIKGRWYGEPDAYHPKYIYIEPTSKSEILYGFYENKEYIKSSKNIYIVEAEKAVQQLASNGIRNCVATGGKTISKTQIELITRTGCSPILAMDQDVKIEELQNIANKFMDGIEVYGLVDIDNILEEKESPSDNIEKFYNLTKNNIVQFK